MNDLVRTVVSLTHTHTHTHSAEEAIQYPVLTFSSGPTNSMRGAVFLSGLRNAIVIDIGGTSADVGVLKDGFPREASTQLKVRQKSVLSGLQHISQNLKQPDCYNLSTFV